MTIIQHPWQNGPVELVEHALYHLHSESDFDKRIAFLLLDIGVETLFKTFLTLPDEVTKAQGTFHDRKAASEGNFHKLVREIGKAAAPRLKGFNLSHIQFYHDLRNKLYHQGNGVTVPTEKAQEYAKLVVDLLRVLLKVDLSDELTKPELAVQLQAKFKEQREEIARLEKDIHAATERLEAEIKFAVERIEPKLVLPSFIRRFNAILSDYEVVQWLSDEGKEPIEAIVIVQDVGKRLEMAKKIVELLDSLIDNSEIKSQLFVPVPLPVAYGESEIETVVLNLVTSEAWPTSSRLYFKMVEIMAAPEPFSWDAEYWLAEMYPKHIPPYVEGMSEEDHLQQVIEDGKELLVKISNICEAVQQ
jgi:hypothetical protein